MLADDVSESILLGKYIRSIVHRRRCRAPYRLRENEVFKNPITARDFRSGARVAGRRERSVMEWRRAEVSWRAGQIDAQGGWIVGGYLNWVTDALKLPGVKIVQDVLPTS
jgi:hypothetical protein